MQGWKYATLAATLWCKSDTMRRYVRAAAVPIRGPVIWLDNGEGELRTRTWISPTPCPLDNPLISMPKFMAMASARKLVVSRGRDA